VAIKVQFRRGLASEWVSSNPVLDEGELGLETDTGLFKIGNGSDTYTSLDYGGLSGADGVADAVSPLVYDSGSKEISIASGASGQILVYNSSVGAWQIVSPPFAPLYFGENAVFGVSPITYTLALTDIAQVVGINNPSSTTVSVPLNSSVPFPLGTIINIYRVTAGPVTISGVSGVTVRNAGSIASQFGEVSLRKRATDEWVLSGDVS
jgi:hypothetical protein